MVVEVLGVQALEQQRPTARVGAEQPDRAGAAPALHAERLVLALVVREGQLEHRRLSVPTHRDHERAEAVLRLSVDDEPPFLRELVQQPWQPVDERRPGRTAFGEGEHVDRELDRRHPVIVADGSSAFLRHGQAQAAAVG